jgi:signal transduction histidine kinase
MNPKVLVIDDEDAARYGMVRALAGEGYELKDTGDSQGALELIDSFQPDVVLSDINMPGMDGLTLVRTIKQREEPPLIILITGYGSERVAADALRAGAYDYIPKPYELNELRSSIRNAVERQKLSQKLKRSEAALIQARKMSALAELVAGVAHEINNPLGVAQSSAQTAQAGMGKLRESITDPSAVRLLELSEASAGQCVEACRRIAQTVSNLTSFVQLDRADFQKFDLNSSIECTAGLIRPHLRSGVELDLHLDTLPEIEGNPRDINQVILNLIRNACEAIERGGSPGAIAVRTSANQADVHLEISDTGVGIAPEHLSSVFDPGFTTKGVGVGIGTGLTICHQIVHAHHGSIQVSSQPGAGATFTVQLPISQSG